MTEAPAPSVCIKHRDVPTPATTLEAFETLPDGTRRYFGLCPECEQHTADSRARSEALLTDIRQKRRIA